MNCSICLSRREKQPRSKRRFAKTTWKWFCLSNSHLFPLSLSPAEFNGLWNGKVFSAHKENFRANCSHLLQIFDDRVIRLNLVSLDYKVEKQIICNAFVLMCVHQLLTVDDAKNVRTSNLSQLEMESAILYYQETWPKHRFACIISLISHGSMNPEQITLKYMRTFQYFDILISIFTCEDDVKCWISWYISIFPGSWFIQRAN